MADIVVFPEKGLTGVEVDYPLEIQDIGGNPCDSTGGWHKVLWLLSCSAQNLGVYLVVNLDEAAADNATSRSTHLAFDRRGNIVAKYSAGSRNYSYFDTDMGLRFGLAFQDDLLVDGGPFMRFLEVNNVTQIAAPVALTNRMPFLTGLQRQWSWSYLSNRALLAAGLVDTVESMAGSGLYCGRAGPLEYTMDWVRRGSMLVQAVPKLPNSTMPHLPQYWDLPLSQTGEVERTKREDVEVEERRPGRRRRRWWRSRWRRRSRSRRRRRRRRRPLNGRRESVARVERETLRGYTTRLLDVTGEPEQLANSVYLEARLDRNFTLCQNQTCCHFNLSIVTRYVKEKDSFVLGMDSPEWADYSLGVYRAVVTDSVQEVDDSARYRVRRCAVVSCSMREDLSSCGLPTGLRYRPQERPDRGLLEVGKLLHVFRLTASFAGRPNVFLPLTNPSGPLVRSSDLLFANTSATSSISLNRSVRSVITAGIELLEPTDSPPTLPYDDVWTTAPFNYTRDRREHLIF